ncbi:MAG TPA: hypothetical protein VL651_15780 [Bacteroidia bacterium]|jgi:hypothetical protein|nr:hypothetical protein [Bacteroidia bacterium]
MRSLLLLLFFLACAKSYGQQDILVAPGKSNALIKVDTIQYPGFAFVQMDTTIASYELSVIIGVTVLYDRVIMPGQLPVDAYQFIPYLTKGSKVYYQNIRKRLPSGGTTRLPDHLYVIK